MNKLLAVDPHDALGDNIKGLICPLDELVQHEEVYMQWTDNISLRVQQYSAFSSAFKQLLEKRRISKPFHMALEQNQNHFLEAIRLFIELDISASAIDGSKGNTEQKLFVHMLKKAQESSLFRFPQTPSREKLKEIVVSLAKKEVEECRGTPQEVKRCERAVGVTKELPFNSIVVHGVHQFTPVQLRLLLAMEKMGMTIIFLFNYQKNYSKIYSSWNDIYGCFEVPIHHDTVVHEYTPPTMQNPSNALACALGEICEDRNAVGSGMLRKWYKLYKSVQLMEFANITEYAHFVSNHFDAAIQRYSESRSVMERGNDVWSNAAVLRYLDEQVYTANRDVHTLLKIYYPEYAKDRHFLSYPIGQFFSAIYRLWDYENGKIMSQLVGNISVDQQRDAFRALVYPSAEFIPCVDFRTRRCIRLLRMDEQLLLKAVLVVVCRRNQKIGISIGIGGDIPGSLGRHLQNDSVFARHGNSLLILL